MSKQQSGVYMIICVGSEEEITGMRNKPVRGGPLNRLCYFKNRSKDIHFSLGHKKGILPWGTKINAHVHLMENSAVTKNERIKRNRNMCCNIET
jgi:hypothetical protein